MRKLVAIGAVLVFSLSISSAKDIEDYPEPQGVAEEALIVAEAGVAAENPEALESAVEKLKALLPSSSPLAEKLISAKQAKPSTAELKERLQELASMLAFVPLAEAELPEGFPTYTPVGMIEKKSYPKLRLAEAKNFFTLFTHITSNDIAMTAPVQMEFEVSDQGRATQESMAFFYGSPGIGKAGKVGPVEVVDKEALEVVALGIRGRPSPNEMRDAQSRLEKWISYEADYKAAGPIRLMGYNSPMVPRDRQFFEIQIPLEKVDAAQ